MRSEDITAAASKDDKLYAIRGDEPEPSLKSDMAAVDRIGSVMRDLVGACRA